MTHTHLSSLLWLVQYSKVLKSQQIGNSLTQEGYYDSYLTLSTLFLLVQYDKVVTTDQSANRKQFYTGRLLWFIPGSLPCSYRCNMTKYSFTQEGHDDSYQSLYFILIGPIWQSIDQSANREQFYTGRLLWFILASPPYSYWSNMTK